MEFLNWDEEEEFEEEYEELETDVWDNSYRAGGLPRDLSPFREFDDPYERSGMEYALFDSIMKQWKG